MNRRALGATGTEVGEVGLGCWQLDNPVWGGPGEADSLAVVGCDACAHGAPKPPGAPKPFCLKCGPELAPRSQWAGPTPTEPRLRGGTA